MLRCKQIESPTATLGAQIDSFLVNNNVKSVINMSTIIRERPALSVAFLIYDDGGRTESHEPKVSNLFGEAKVTSELKSSNSVTGQDNSEISKDVLPAVVNSKAETITDNARVMSNLAMSVGNGVKPKRRLGLGMGD